jgi:hypothetical protein
MNNLRIRIEHSEDSPGKLDISDEDRFKGLSILEKEEPEEEPEAPGSMI